MLGAVHACEWQAVRLEDQRALGGLCLVQRVEHGRLSPGLSLPNAGFRTTVPTARSPGLFLAEAPALCYSLAALLRVP